MINQLEWYREQRLVSILIETGLFLFFNKLTITNEKVGVRMKNTEKYSRGYFMPPVKSLKWTEKEYITEAPTWCSVDLRDGNQALVVPMSLEEKLEYFQLLLQVGFKEIEVGFPAASETEYAFLRTLIEENLIPDDVTIQVLTQSREHIIQKTFEALQGVNKAVVHFVQFHICGTA